MSGSYAAQVAFSDYVLMERPEYVEFAIERMKQEGAIKVFAQIYEHGHPVVVETHLEEWHDLGEMKTKYTLHYRLTAVTKRDVVIEVPVFTFTNHEGQVEWKCPACSIINKIEATYCGEMHQRAVGCGRPRDEVIRG